MVSKLSIKKRLFLYSIFCSLLGGFAFYTYLLFNTKSNIYYVDFNTSVSGLKKGSSVKYKGIVIGVVEDIDFHEPLDVIRLTIRVDYNFNLYADYVPMINAQGLSGVCDLEFDRDLTLKHEKIPFKYVLNGKVSFLDNVKESVSYTVNDIGNLVRIFNEKLTKEDIDHLKSIISSFDKTMQNIEKMTNKCAENDEDIAGAVQKLNDCLDILKNSFKRAEQQKPMLWKWLFGSKKS